MSEDTFTNNPDSVMFWDHAENARLYQLEQDKLMAISKARDIFIAHAVQVLGNLPANKDAVSALESYKRYKQVKKDASS